MVKSKNKEICWFNLSLFAFFGLFILLLVIFSSALPSSHKIHGVIKKENFVAVVNCIPPKYEFFDTLPFSSRVFFTGGEMTCSFSINTSKNRICDENKSLYRIIQMCKIRWSNYSCRCFINRNSIPLYTSGRVDIAFAVKCISQDELNSEVNECRSGYPIDKNDVTIYRSIYIKTPYEIENRILILASLFITSLIGLLGIFSAFKNLMDLWKEKQKKNKK